MPYAGAKLWNEEQPRLLAWIPFADIAALAIGGPGAQTSGGGFIGGGFGLEGVAVGMLVGTALNLLTTRTRVDTVICVRTLSAELFLHHGIEAPDQVRLRMSPVFTALRQLEAARQVEARPFESADSADLVSRLAQLTDLHAQGSLTDEEFAAFKAKLMELARDLVVRLVVSQFSRAACSTPRARLRAHACGLCFA